MLVFCPTSVAQLTKHKKDVTIQNTHHLRIQKHSGMELQHAVKNKEGPGGLCC